MPRWTINAGFTLQNIRQLLSNRKPRFLWRSFGLNWKRSVCKRWSTVMAPLAPKLILRCFAVKSDPCWPVFVDLYCLWMILKQPLIMRLSLDWYRGSSPHLWNLVWYTKVSATWPWACCSWTILTFIPIDHTSDLLTLAYIMLNDYSGDIVPKLVRKDMGQLLLLRSVTDSLVYLL